MYTYARGEAAVRAAQRVDELRAEIWGLRQVKAQLEDRLNERLLWGLSFGCLIGVLGGAAIMYAMLGGS